MRSIPIERRKKIFQLEEGTHMRGIPKERRKQIGDIPVGRRNT